MNSLHRTALVTLVTAGLGAGLAPSAFADTTPIPNPGVSTAPSAPADTVGSTKARCDAAIDRRVADLAKWDGLVQATLKLTGDQKQALTSELQGVSSGLTSVAKPAVDAAATKADLKAACQAIVTDYRVYRVVHPQVFISAAADSEEYAISVLQDTSAQLAAQGADTSAVDALLAGAMTTASGVPNEVVGITPASYDADPAGTQATFNGARHELTTVKGQIRQARTMLRSLARHLH